MSAPAVELDGITRRFGEVTAVDRVTLRAATGEILALVGENGAGKSTLMNVLYGIHRPDAGVIRIAGMPLIFRGPADAIAAGIGMVHQHFTLVPTLTVAENVTLGDEPHRGWRFDAHAAEEKVFDLAAKLGFTLDPRALVQDLSVGAQQRVEILKSLARGARILILDEPTAVLTPQEADELAAVLRTLAAGGTTILFVSHKLAEVAAVSSRVAVMRNGRLVAELETARTSPHEIAREMVGRDPVPLPTRAPSPPGAPLLRLERVAASTDRALPALFNVTLEVRSGEILGIAGVEGNGQAELVEVIAGLRATSSGRLTLLGLDGAAASPAERLDAGLAHVPGDRLRDAVVPQMTVEENVRLGRHRELARAAVAPEAARVLESFDVRPRNASITLASLSGGNQQKVVVGRELGRQGAPARLVLAVHPTRGVDVGAIERIHAALLEARDAGAGILLVSADLAEVLALADRIAVLYDGRIAHETAARDTDERSLGPWMTGAGNAAQGGAR